ncbi:MAG: hypothetical protein JXR77_02430 [Lentisphaeria bacterium]|nr:hypothetical protein [Lentisphaeria bacterium]
MSRRSLRLVLLLLAGALSAAEPGAVHLRHLNYVVLRPEEGFAGGDLRVDSIRHGYRAYEDGLDCTLVGADSAIAARAAAGPGGSVTLSLEGAAGALLALEVRSGWNLAVAHLPPGMAWALRSGIRAPLETVREWGPLRFFVPEGSAYFNLWIQAAVSGEGAHLVVRDPDGGVVLEREDDFDTRTKLQIRVPGGHAGRAWSVELLRCGTPGLATDDVAFELGRHLPPFLTPRADWAVRFAADWRYDPDAPGPPADVAPVAPRRPAYQPLPPERLAPAYERRGGPEWRTSLPFTYVLDYGPHHLADAEYVATVGKAPPVLLHLGKDVPFNHGWGPVRALGGENQAFGKGDAITRLEPEEVRQRLAALTDLAARLHAAGVRTVTPYICAMTLNGDPDRRSGFWEFYDHWDEYRALGLGARPATDPGQWLQTTPEGQPKLYYAYDMGKGCYPPFETNHRFAACWHTDGWRTWLLEVVRFVARCGFDGVFVDNGTSQRSTSAAALRAFRQYLAARTTPEQALDRLGIEALDGVLFPAARDATPLAAEMQRFWCVTIRDQMAAIKAAGSTVLGREFVVFPNGGHPAAIQEALRDTDFVMFEKSAGSHGTHPGLVLDPIVGDLALRSLNDNIFEYVFVRSLRERVRPVVLTRPGYPQSRPWLRLNADAARLGMAECAAFSGGGGFLLRPRFDVYQDALNEYREFFESHPELYAGLLPHEAVTVLALAEQDWLGNGRHLALVRRLTPMLADAHVPFGFLSERRLDRGDTPPAATLVACGLSGLPASRLRVLADHVRAGGSLLLTDRLTADGAPSGPHGNVPAILDPQAGTGGRVRLLDDLESVPAALAPHAIPVRREDGGSTAGLRLALYRSPDGRRLLCHLVNVHVPLGTAAPPPEVAENVRVSLPIPEAARVAGFRVLSPDQPSPLEAELTQTPGAATVRLPSLRIYAVIELGLEPRP